MRAPRIAFDTWLQLEIISNAARAHLLTKAQALRTACEEPDCEGCENCEPEDEPELRLLNELCAEITRYKVAAYEAERKR